MNKIFATIILAVGLMTGSCSDYLDVLPKDKQATDMYWKSSADVESILAQGYSVMRTCVPTMISWGEVRGGSLITYQATGYKIQNFQVLPSSDDVKWDKFYQVIGLANAVIKYAPGVMAEDESYKEAQMNSHLTEAYFMRGLMYLYLVRNYRDVPLILEPYVDDEMPTDVAKSSEKEILAQIKKDVETALATGAAKESYESTWANKGRSTKWALYALMAETCLWDEDYDNCIKYADYLINADAPMRPVFISSGAQWFQMFYPGNSNESIFEIQFNGPTYNQVENSPAKTFAYNVETPTYMYSENMTLRLNEELLQNSYRTYFGSCAMLNGLIVCGTTYVNNAIVWKYAGMGVENVEAVRSGNNLDANFIVYRMADVMLMKAEALIRKGGVENWTEAVAIMDKIRERSGLAPLDVTLEETSELDLLTLLLNERDMEFAAEGKRWYDLLRFGKQQNFKYKDDFISIIMENNQTGNEKWLRSALQNDNAWYLPIPQGDIDSNKLLVQNPYYDVTKQ